MSTSNRSHKAKTTSNSSPENPATAGTDGALKPSPVQLFKQRLEKQLANEGLKFPILDKNKALHFEFVYMKGYMDAMPEGNEKKFLGEFLSLIYACGRSVTTLGV